MNKYLILNKKQDYIELLNTSITKLKGVGEKTEKSLKKKNITTIKELINWYPKKFLDTRKIYSVSEIYKLLDKKGNIFSNFIGITKPVYGQIIQVDLFTTPRRKIKILELKIQDPKTKDKLIIQYFNQPYLAKIFKINQKYIFFGKILKKGVTAYLTNPTYEKYSKRLLKFGRITPIYVNKSKYITNNKLRKLIYQTIPLLEKIPEFIDKKTIEQNNLIPISQAFLSIHFPKNIQVLQKAIKRLQIQELLELLNQEKGHSLNKNLQVLPKIEISNFLQEYTKIIKQLEYNVNFKLTQQQKQIINDIINALDTENQSIFLYGDVGAGKTIIFLILTMLFLQAGYNVLFMAPTKILAEQHYKNAGKLFKDLNLKFKIQQAHRITKNTNHAFKSTLIIGTTKLLFLTNQIINNVGLIGIDEEHKFGVKHRQELITKYTKENTPYVISMSATPIPRTLAHNFYGFNKSFYLTTTPFSKKIITKLSNIDKLNEIFAWLKNKLTNKKEQAYIVLPRILSENYEINIQEFAPIIKEWLSPIKTEILHGLIPQEKQIQIAQEFKQNKIKALISTSLIEVGIDSPNASIIIILGAEMFGLAQLHQLRGRVGRHGQKSYCILVPSPNITEKNIERLQLFTKIKDGLQLARLDLKLRGPGTVLAGTQQTGLNKTKIANLYDFNTMKKALAIYNNLKNQKIDIPNIIT